MMKFIAAFGATFGLETSEEVLVAYISSLEAVMNTGNRNFRGDWRYNAFLDTLLGKPTAGIIGLTGNDCLETNAVRAIAGQIAARARRSAAAVQQVLPANAAAQSTSHAVAQPAASSPTTSGGVFVMPESGKVFSAEAGSLTLANGGFSQRIDRIHGDAASDSPLQWQLAFPKALLGEPIKITLC